MKIKCYTKNPSKYEEILKDKVEFETLEEVLKESDIINVRIPLNKETKKLNIKRKIYLMS